MWFLINSISKITKLLIPKFFQISNQSLDGCKFWINLNFWFCCKFWILNFWILNVLRVTRVNCKFLGFLSSFWKKKICWIVNFDMNWTKSNGIVTFLNETICFSKSFSNHPQKDRLSLFETKLSKKELENFEF